MNTRTLEFTVVGQYLKIITCTKDLIANSRNYLYCHFALPTGWETTTAVFETDTLEPIKVIVDSTGTCKIPNEVLTSTSFKVSLFSGDRITTNVVGIKLGVSGPVEGVEPQGDDVIWYEQVMKRMNEIDTSAIDVTNLATKTELEDAIKNVTVDTTGLATKESLDTVNTTLTEQIVAVDGKLTTLNDTVATKADKTAVPTLVSQLTNDKNYSTVGEVNTKVNTAMNSLNFDAYATKAYVDEQILASSTGEIDLSTYATKEEVTQAKNYLNATSKPQINSVELVGNKSLADLGIVIPTQVTELTNNAGYQTKADVDTAITEATKNLKVDAYTKAEIDTKVNTINTNVDTKADKTTVDNLTQSVLNTSTDLQGQISTMKGELTTASENMTQSLTNMSTKLTQTADSINARYDELVANVTSNLSTLNATDSTLRADIDTINSKIPNSASTTNKLADKAYVDEQIKNAAARAISADTNGNGFASLEVLNAGPWYSLGVSTTPEKNDYAVVKKDATHSGNDVRYNYDGSVWVFFQEFTSGSSWTPTTDESLALASGITAEKVALIDTNKTAIAEETTNRNQAITLLEGKLTDEATTREQADNNLATQLSGEKLARENADNQILSKITDEETARINGDNNLTLSISNLQSTLQGNIGTLANLATDDKTSIVNAINEVHDTTYTRDVTDTILTNQYASKFDTLTATLTARCNAIEQDVATLKSMTASTKYLNKAGEFGIFLSGNTKTMNFTDTNLKANEIALRHDTTNTNNTMTDVDYGNGIMSNVQKVWFSDVAGGGLTLHYLYNGGSGRCVFEMTYVATGDIIGYIVIGTSYWQSMTVDDIVWSQTIYSNTPDTQQGGGTVVTVDMIPITTLEVDTFMV